MLISKIKFHSLNSIILIINSLLFVQCNTSLIEKDVFKYKMNEPVLKHVLNKNLKEVSGLSFNSNENVSLIDDEEGAIFIYNLKTNAVKRKILFSKDGDFEDLKIVGDTAYIIRSDGKLFVLKNLYGPKSGMIENKINTGLTKKNNTEGLCYDDKKNLLLIACKDNPGNNKKYL